MNWRWYIEACTLRRKVSCMGVLQASPARHAQTCLCVRIAESSQPGIVLWTLLELTSLAVRLRKIICWRIHQIVGVGASLIVCDEVVPIGCWWFSCVIEDEPWAQRIRSLDVLLHDSHHLIQVVSEQLFVVGRLAQTKERVILPGSRFVQSG